jgi:hypothetical protein
VAVALAALAALDRRGRLLRVASGDLVPAAGLLGGLGLALALGLPADLAHLALLGAVPRAAFALALLLRLPLALMQAVQRQRGILRPLGLAGSGFARQDPP